MRSLALVFLIAQITSAILNNTDNPPGLDVREPQDVDVRAIGEAGSPVSPKRTIIFFQIMQLDIYKSTVLRGKDENVPEEVWSREFGQLQLQLIPLKNSKMTWADALWGIQIILRGMTYPQFSAGFREQRWVLFRENRVGTTIKMGEILFHLRNSNSVLGSNATVSDSAYSNTTFLTQPPLSVPFQVPTTDMFLLTGARGVNLPQAPVIQAMDGMVAIGYIDFAKYKFERPVPEVTTRMVEPSGATDAVMLPRMIDGVSQMTTTDLVELAVGVVYYMALNEFYATTITAVKPDQSGKRTPRGEIQISMAPALNGSITVGNASVEIS